MYWNWWQGGLALGLVFFLAVALVKPIGVSTQFVIFDGVLTDMVDDEWVREDATTTSGYDSSNAYLAKSGGKYAAAAANPVNYSFVFVLAMLAGGFIGGRVQRRSPENRIKQVPAFHAARFGHTSALRYTLAFAGGALVLFGARLAGGCTSGHMMSGTMQTAISGYVFAAAAFAVAVPLAILMYPTTAHSKTKRV